jgi:hypothetical protein
MRVASLRVASLRVASLRVASLRFASLRFASLRVGSLRVASLRVTAQEPHVIAVYILARMPARLPLGLLLQQFHEIRDHLKQKV